MGVARLVEDDRDAARKVERRDQTETYAALDSAGIRTESD